MKYFLLFFLIISISACEKKSPLMESQEELLIGVWTRIENDDSEITLKRVSSLPDNEFAIEFKEKGKLLEIKNGGWCATPPITYEKYSGSWKLTSDTIIEIESEYWGGTESMEWQIVELNDKELKYLVIEFFQTYPAD